MFAKVFTDGRVREIEAVMRESGYSLTRQSGMANSQEKHKFLPRTYHRSGYIPAKSKDSGARTAMKRSGQEIPGIMLVYLLTLLSEHPTCFKMRKKIGPERVADYTKLFDLLLTFDKWMKQDDISKESLRMAEDFVAPFMVFYKKTLNRLIGDGVKTKKTHYMRHVIHDIIINGVPLNYTGQVGESNFKFTAKNVARRTQKQAQLLDKQTAIRSAEYTCIARASSEASKQETGHWSYFWGSETKSPNLNRKGGRVLCQFDETNSKVMTRIAGANSKLKLSDLWKSSALSYEDFEGLLKESILPSLGQNGQLEFFTEYIQAQHNDDNGDPTYLRYRAHPFCRGTSWHSWAYIFLPGYQRPVPCHLLFFLEIRGIAEDDETVPKTATLTPSSRISEEIDKENLVLTDSSGCLRNGKYALVHRVPEDPFTDLAGNDSKPEHTKLYGYGEGMDTLHMDLNCNIVRWSAKVAPGIFPRVEEEKSRRRGKKRKNTRKNTPRRGHIPKPKLSLVSLSNVRSPCIAIPDEHSLCPHVWFFVAP